MLLRPLRTLVVAVTLSISCGVLMAGPAHADDQDLDSRETKTAAATAGKSRPAATSRRAVRRAAARATPLTVTIETLTPSVIPKKGKVRLTGEVLNTDSVPWLTVNVYSFISEDPLTTRAQLAAAARSDETQSVGQRIIDQGNYGTIDEIAPGESKSFSFAVDVDLLEGDIPNTPGVYWFGVHALGERSGEPRDELFLADGRARTFLPLVPPEREGKEAVSVVVPLRRELSYAEDGALDDLDEWTTTLGDGGRLRSLVALAATSGDRTVSWVVDPALVDAVRQLAKGNPPRSVAANLEEGEEPDPTETGAPGESPSEEPSPTDDAAEDEDPTTAELPDDLDPETAEAAEVAREWLGLLRGAITDGDEVFVLPYGDVDISAAARHDKDDLLDRSRERSSTGLPGIDVPTTPVIDPPSGYLSPGGMRITTEDETVIVGDKLFADAPSIASVAGHRMVVTSSGAADGGPAPGDVRGIIAMRQRILAEAAIRFLKPARSPLVVQFPYDWIPPASTSFFSGFDVDWVDLTSVDDATGALEGEVVADDEVTYPQRQTDYELDAVNFVAAETLLERGDALDTVLTRNDLIGATVADQALTSTSYAARARPESSRAETDRSSQWIDDRLSQVEVEAPPTVTLSSINGSFPTTISNKLDEPVAVSLAAESDDDQLTISAPTEVEIPAQGSQTVLLDARTDTPGVHDVTILVTDSQGRPLGGSDELSVRSARVSNAIWLFLAGGIGLLFGTIGVRLFRRVRASRRPSA
jgi:hypothetical protein